MSKIKLCVWCELPLERGRKSKKEWARAVVHRQCLTSYKHHRCAKSAIPPLPDKWCESCGQLLVRRDNEHLQSWQKRKFCDKSCAAKGKVGKRVPSIAATPDEETRSGVIRYKPGSPEFRQIAALYGG